MATRRCEPLPDLANRGCEPAGEGLSADLDAELNRLPDRYRLPLVLCCLQGLSYDEAANQLKVKPGTLSGRLSRAKALLRDRLLARGVVVPAIAAFLADTPRGSALSPELVRTITTAAFAAPGNARAEAVADGVTRMMTLQSFARRSFALLALAAVVLLGGSFVAQLAADEPKTPAPADPPKARAKTDKELLQGDWVFDSAEAVGGTNAIDQAWHSVVTFDGDKLTVTKYMGFDWHTTFKIDPTQSPKQFEMTVNELARKLMGFKDGTIKGIYRFDGVALEICLGESPDAPRPTEFDTGPKLKQFRFTLKRKAKEFDPAKADKFTVKVIDADGKTVKGAVVCQSFSASMQETNILVEKGTPYKAVQVNTQTVPPLPATDKNGETTYDPTAGGFDGLRPNGVLYIRHDKRKLVAIEPISPARIAGGVTVTLRPEAKLTGKVVCPDGTAPGPTNVYLSAHKVRWVQAFHSHKPEFEFIVPVGEYELLAGGTYLDTTDPQTVAVGIEGKTLKVEAKPNKLGSLRGKPAPDLGEMAAWKGKEPKLADLKGKAVLLTFFSPGANTDFVYSYPELTRLHTDLADKGLVVIGVLYPAHGDKPVTTVKEFDKRMEAIRTKDWPKGDIAFPVGLLATADGPAAKAYGLGASHILIDRKGNVVGAFNPFRGVDVEKLEKLLAER
jgi:uncharacterized protein (TIGR03067 family)